MENKSNLKGILILVVASVFWGLAFSVQSIGGRDIGTYTFNASRMLLGAAFLIPVIKVFDRKGFSTHIPSTKEDRKRLWKYGIVSGIFLAIASNLQQAALAAGAQAGRAGFLTALYILLVPVVGIFMKKKFGWNTWAGAFIAIAGMYFLCVEGAFGISAPDLLLILCALAFTFQICTVDLASEVDAIRFSAIQFLTCGIISAILCVLFEMFPSEGGFSSWASCFSTGTFWLTILYMAIFSTGIGYTLQALGQRELSPPVASLVMSLESVFSVFFGFLILKEIMTGRQLLGCGLIFAAIILSQLPVKSFRHASTKP